MLKRFWRFLGDLFRIKTIGELFGLWTTATWQNGAAWLAASAVTLFCRYLRAPVWSLPLILLSTIAVSLIIIVKIKQLRTPSKGGVSPTQFLPLSAPLPLDAATPRLIAPSLFLPPPSP